MPGGGYALPGLLVRLRLSVGPASNLTAPPGDGIRHGVAFMPGGGYALPGLLVRLRLSVGPASKRRRLAMASGTELRLCRMAAAPLPGLQPQITAGAGAAETAGAGGLNIAETFPKPGSPHGCGLRAVFCRDAASARPGSLQDKSKDRAAAMLRRSPGYRGGGDWPPPVHAPSAMSDIAQKNIGSAICPEIT